MDNSALDNVDLPPAYSEILSQIAATLDIEKALLARTSDRKAVPKEGVAARMRDHAHAKAALAVLYCRYAFDANADSWWKKHLGPIPRNADDGDDSLQRVFVESGSTLLYLANELRKQRPWAPDVSLYHNPLDYPDGARRFSTWTNNNLAAHLFLTGEHPKPNCVAEPPYHVVPYLLSGYLESKYEGVFAFYPQQHAPAKDPDRRLSRLKVKEERLGYAQTRICLAQCGVLLLAASKFSLIHGPLVGSRENAIFKNACYNACVPALEAVSRHEIHLFITANKLVTHTGASELPGWSSFEEEIAKVRDEKCFPVFDLHLQDGASETWPSPFSRLIGTLDHNPAQLSDLAQPLPDDTRAVRLGEGRFRICDKWLDLFEKGDLAVKVFISYKTDGKELVQLNCEQTYAQERLPSLALDFQAAVAAEGAFGLACLTIRKK